MAVNDGAVMKAWTKAPPHHCWGGTVRSGGDADALADPAFSCCSARSRRGCPRLEAQNVEGSILTLLGDPSSELTKATWARLELPTGGGGLSELAELNLSQIKTETSEFRGQLRWAGSAVTSVSAGFPHFCVSTFQRWRPSV